ncbi:hypothetical protein KKD62_01795 [Patescibacteria group bacterium]|nr:hypothetical protein [Patescibacteria group bacterium]MBU1931084.1 hypothetical protein [Patescibacteria group bacterium]
MSEFLKAVGRVVHGDVTEGYQKVEGTFSVEFTDLLRQGKRGQARRLLEDATPAFKAVELVVDAGHLPLKAQPTPLHLLKRQTRQAPKRRRGHSKRWSKK